MTCSFDIIFEAQFFLVHSYFKTKPTLGWLRDEKKKNGVRMDDCAKRNISKKKKIKKKTLHSGMSLDAK